MRRINSSTEGFCSGVAGVCAKAGLANTAKDTQHKTRNSGIPVPPKADMQVENQSCHRLKRRQGGSIDRSQFLLECVVYVSNQCNWHPQYIMHWWREDSLTTPPEQ
jgi:hypothetical protein